MDSNLIQVKKETSYSITDEQQNRKKLTNAVDENGNKVKTELQPKVEEIDEKLLPIPTNPIAQNEVKKCRCLIDLSSPASLERDFYAWLNGVEPISDSISRRCLFSRPSTPPPLPAQFAPFHPQTTTTMLMPSDRLQMLTLAECPAHLMGLPNIGHPTNFVVELPAFLVAPSDCSSSASSSFSSSASASSSSISPGGTATHYCCQFASSAESGIIGDLVDQQHRQQIKQPQPQTLATISAFSASNDEGTKSLPPPPPTIRMRRKRNVDKASGRGTNLYGRTYCPGRPLSMDERGQIINLFHGGMKVNAISKQLCISHGCVSKIITRFRETGNLMPSSHSECRRRKRLLLQQQQQQMDKKGP